MQAFRQDRGHQKAMLILKPVNLWNYSIVRENPLPSEVLHLLYYFEILLALLDFSSQAAAVFPVV